MSSKLWGLILQTGLHWSVCVNPDLNDEAPPTPTADDYDDMTSYTWTTDSYQTPICKTLYFIFWNRMEMDSDSDHVCVF